MSLHRCPQCNAETVYQSFSGGREWWCAACEMNGDYPTDGSVDLPRATLLQTPEGRVELAQQMREHVDAKRQATHDC